MKVNFCVKLKLIYVQVSKNLPRMTCLIFLFTFNSYINYMKKS